LCNQAHSLLIGRVKPAEELKTTTARRRVKKWHSESW
jgi:hypothetical protein